MMLSIHDILNDSIMTSTPWVVVEGIDDIPIYEGIAKLLGKDVEVAAVETIATPQEEPDVPDVPYTQGSEGVKSAIEDLNNRPPDSVNSEKCILGIIDRDVREYRNELPFEKGLLVLEMYSIESHFVCREVFDKLLNIASAVNPEYLSVQVRDQIYSWVELQLQDFYYFALESLKKAIDADYVADFQYSMGGGARKQEHLRLRVMAKKENLKQFAAQMGFSESMPTLRKIVKGKWLYEGFCGLIFDAVTNLSSYCGQNDARQCQFCAVGNSEKCQYGAKAGISAKALHSIGRDMVSTPNLHYVKNRINILAPEEAA